MTRAERLYRFLVRHRWLVLLLHAGLFAGALVGAARVRVDYSAEQFLIFEGPERRTFEEFKEHFPREDLQVSAFLKVSGRPGSGDYRTLERLAAAFHDAGLRDVQRARFEDAVEASRDRSPFTGWLWNRDLSVLAVHGFLEPAENTDARRREVEARLRAEVASIPDGPDRIVLNGLPILRVSVPLALEADIARLLLIALAVSFVVLLLYFRQLWPVVVCFAAILPSIFLTLGLLGFAGRPVSVLTSAVPIVILVIALSDAIHLVVGTRERRREGHPLPDAVAVTFATLTRSCFFTSLTTALGFVGLVATRNRLVGEFGVVTALAVLVAFGVTMTLLPALLAFSRGSLGREGSAAERACQWIVRRAGQALSWRPRWVTGAFAACLAAGLVLAAGLRVEALLIDDLKPGDPILRELRWIEDAGFGVFQVNVFLKHDSVPGDAPEVLAWAADLQDWAGSDSLVIGSIGLPQLAAAMGPGAAGAGAAGTGPGVTRAPTAGPRDGSAVEDFYLPDEGVSQVVLFVRDAGSSRLSPFLLRLDERLRDRPPPGGTAEATGTVKLSQVLWDRLVSQFLPAIVLSIVLVWAALAWLFRSARVGAIALVPNLVPLVLLLGIMRLGGFDLKPSTLMVFAIAFGIVADDTIHFLGAFSRHHRGSADVDDALARSVKEVGVALIVTTVAVGAGFAVLAASRFQVLFLVGLLTATAAVLGLAADLLGFPALLKSLSRWSGVRSVLSRASGG